jgi:hypothetical protein
VCGVKGKELSTEINDIDEDNFLTDVKAALS